jgi:hypothetical protein
MIHLDYFGSWKSEPRSLDLLTLVWFVLICLIVGSLAQSSQGWPFAPGWCWHTRFPNGMGLNRAVLCTASAIKCGPTRPWLMLCIAVPQQLVPMQVSESTSARQMIYTLMDTNSCASEFWHLTGCRKQRFVPGEIGVPCKHADLVKLHQSLLDAPDSNTRPSYDSAVEIQNSKCMRCKDLPEPHKNRKQQHHMQCRLCNWRLLDSSLAVFCSASNGPWFAFVGSVDRNQCARYILVLICTDESIRPKWPGRTKAHG